MDRKNNNRGRVKRGPISRNNTSNTSRKDSRLKGRSGPKKRSNR